MKYKQFSDLPQSIRNRILQLNQPTPEKWVLKKVNALKNKTIIEIINEKDGLQKINEYLLKIEGYF